MTTIAIPQRSNPIPVLAILAMAALALLSLGLANRARVVNGEHSLAKHGAEAAAIHRCLDDNGPAELWAFTSWRRHDHYIQTCRLEDGRWGLRIIQRVKGAWQERTSFIVKDGSREKLVEYVTARCKIMR